MGAIPWLNDILNLVVVPQELRTHVMFTLMLSLIGSFLWDRLMLMTFAPEISQCYISEAKATTFMDFYPLLKTVGMVLGGLIFLGAGNPIMWGIAFMIYRSHKSSQQQPGPLLQVRVDLARPRKEEVERRKLRSGVWP